MRPFPRRFLPLLALAVGLAACGDSSPTSIAVGQAAPTFSLPSLDGPRLESRALEGRPVVLNFWASWCQPCRREIPMLQELARSERVQVVGIALDQRGEQTVRPFVEEFGIDYPVVLGNEEVFRRFDGYSIPYTLVLDSAHQVVAIHRGPVTQEALEGDLARFVAEGPRSPSSRSPS